MSVSPNNKDRDWAANLPAIPSTTGVFWPSVTVGMLCIFFGIYLILTPVVPTSDSSEALHSPLPETTSQVSDPETSEQVKVLRCAFVDSKDSTFAVGLEELARDVAERTNGELVIELLPGGVVDGKTLGERELVEMVKGGKLAMAISTTSPLSNFNHDLDLFDLPFVLSGFQHVDAVLDGAIGEQFLSSLEEHNLHGLGYLEVGFRIFSSSIPFSNYESFKGKRLRVMESVTASRFVKAIGGDPVPAPVDKIYLMAKEGYIDGASRTYPTYWDFRLYEVHRFISETWHAYSVKMILMDQKLFKSLSPQYQTALKEASRKASQLQRKKQREADLNVKKLAIEEGIKIFELTDKDRKKFVEASVELYDEYRKNRSSTILEQVEQAAKSFGK